MHSRNFFLSGFRSFRDITDVMFLPLYTVILPAKQYFFSKKRKGGGGLALGHKAAENSWASAGPRKFWTELLDFLHNFCDR